MAAFQISATAFSQDEVGVNQLLAELCHSRPRAEYQPLPVKTGPFREGMFLSPATRIKGWREIWALVRALQLHRPSPLESHPWQGQLVVTAFPLWLRRSRQQLAPRAGGGPAAAASPRRRRWCPGAAAAAAPPRPAAVGRARPGAARAAAGAASRRAPGPPWHGPRRRPPGLLHCAWASRSL